MHASISSCAAQYIALTTSLHHEIPVKMASSFKVSNKLINIPTFLAAKQCSLTPLQSHIVLVYFLNHVIMSLPLQKLMCLNTS